MADIKDDFWDIQKLVPKKEKPRYISMRHDTEAVEINADPPAVTDEPPTFIHRTVALPTREKKEEPLFEYSPVSPLISSVRVFGRSNNFSYYDQFCDDAMRVREMTPEACEHVPYFSYVPQYVQLNREQFNWYLYFRDCVRNGKYPECDYSYILLLIYEIINLGELADVAEGQTLLCSIHKNYRKAYPKLDRILGEWICDYSILHKLPPPKNAPLIYATCFNSFDNNVAGIPCRISPFFVTKRKSRKTFAATAGEHCNNNLSLPLILS